MEAIQTESKQKSDRNIARELLGQYKSYDQTQKESSHEKKAIELALLEIAERHPEWFDGKTAHFEGGRLKWVASSKIELPEDFDMKTFKKKFPNLVRVIEQVQLGKARAYVGDPNYEKFGIEIMTYDTFKVEV